jgi:predicted homoserine dehydrogenase-like protein
MSLYTQLLRRAADRQPIRVGLIGAGKFGSMYLAQVPRTPGVHLVAIADLNPAAARKNLARVGWLPAQSTAASAQAALRDGTTWITDDWQAVVRLPQVDIVVECTGSPVHAVDHILAAIAERKHVVNVTVEADAFCGPLLAL